MRPGRVTPPPGLLDRLLGLVGPALPWLLSVIGLLFGAAVLFPVFARSRGCEHGPTCRTNLRQLGMALEMYTEDYEGRLPPAETWSAVTYPYVKNSQVYVCPKRDRFAWGYAYDLLLNSRAGATLGAPEQQPALFDSSRNRPNAADLLQSFVRHPNTDYGTVAFADGHVKLVREPPSADAGMGKEPIR